MAGDRREERQGGLRRRMATEGLDAALITHLPNIRYLTGFTGSAALLLVRRDDAVLFTDFRYATQAPDEVGESARVEIDAASTWERLHRLCGEAPDDTVGFEAHALTVRDAGRLKQSVRRTAPMGELVEGLRVTKAPEEVAAIAAAADLATAALAEVLPTVHPGQTELLVASRLEAALRRRGSEWHPFQTIVASGPRAALPHAHTTEREIRPGEFLLLDFGAQVDGYCSDLTRTVVVGGRADTRQREAYEAVRAAQARARTEIRAGMTGREADALARDVLAARGMADAFGHSLGHGLGLEVHEAPRLSATADTILPVGAVVTIEPGFYLPGWGGIRLEDDVVLGPDGPRDLSDGRTELVELV
ncbi:MAG TPA: aminopeptidase P family protein [Gemmatimonadales bacterium]|nr:aminopeptidase P family protein [Gemmatimonadales bacterium]